MSDELAPDQTVWEYGQPNETGLSEEFLLNLNARIQLNEFLEINGLIIIKDEKLVYENYYNRSDSLGITVRIPTLTRRNEPFNLGGAGLTYTLAAIGVADDLRILSIEDPIVDYLPEYQSIFEEDPDKLEITIEDLILHKSGLSWNTSIQPLSLQNDLNEMRASDDWVQFILEQPMEAPAGLRFNLNTSIGVLLAKIIEEASGDDFESFIREKVLDLLTINDFQIELDPSGNYNAGTGINTSLLDWTKLGYLFLNDGLWEGRKILDPEFAEAATSLQTEVSGTYTLGYVWWQFGANFANSFPVPYQEIYYIPGELDQHIYVIPSENMIISIFADNLLFGFGNPSLSLFLEVINSVQ